MWHSHFRYPLFPNANTSQPPTPASKNSPRPNPPTTPSDDKTNSNLAPHLPISTYRHNLSLQVHNLQHFNRIHDVSTQESFCDPAPTQNSSSALSVVEWIYPLPKAFTRASFSYLASWCVHISQYQPRIFRSTFISPVSKGPRCCHYSRNTT